MDTKDKALKLHAELKGKFSIESKKKIKNKEDLSLLYTPGVAEACKKIAEEPDKVYDYTIKNNSVAVITDGSAVLGLGDIGPKAALPVMEGKAVLFKEFANVDAYPLCLKRNDVEECIQNIVNLTSSFGGINLEDIKAPYCFEIEEKLKEKTDIPIFHDDQHGTAIVVMAGLINALKLAEKKIEEVEIVITGAGAAGFAVAKLLKTAGAKNITVLDSKGVVYQGRESNNEYNEKLAILTESDKEGTLSEVIKGADVFIGVSKAGILKPKMVKNMNDKPIIFALANPEPEIYPEQAKKAGAFIIATGRSDYPNQINNVLAFPGVFRGVLDARASQINEEMKLKAAKRIAALVKDDLRKNKIVPDVFEKEVAYQTAIAVAKEAVKTGVAKSDYKFEDIKARIRNNLKIK